MKIDKAILHINKGVKAAGDILSFSLCEEGRTTNRYFMNSRNGKTENNVYLGKAKIMALAACGFATLPTGDMVNLREVDEIKNLGDYGHKKEGRERLLITFHKSNHTHDSLLKAGVSGDETVEKLKHEKSLFEM